MSSCGIYGRCSCPYTLCDAYYIHRMWLYACTVRTWYWLFSSFAGKTRINRRRLESRVPGQTILLCFEGFFSRYSRHVRRRKSPSDSFIDNSFVRRTIRRTDIGTFTRRRVIDRKTSPVWLFHIGFTLLLLVTYVRKSVARKLF